MGYRAKRLADGRLLQRLPSVAFAILGVPLLLSS